MTKGTAPSYILSFAEEIDFSAVTFFTVAIKQGSTLIKIDDPVIDTENKTLSVTLSQEQTLKLSSGEASLQVKGKFADGTIFASDIQKVPVNPILDERVIE